MADVFDQVLAYKQAQEAATAAAADAAATAQSTAEDAGTAASGANSAAQDATNAATSAQTAAEAAQTGLSDTIEALMRGWNKESGTSWSLPGLADLFDLGSAKSRELTEIAAGLAELKADRQGNNNSGVSFEVAVADHAGIPPMFTKFYDVGSGAVYNDGNTLQLPTEDALELFACSQPLMTDYFETSLIIPTIGSSYFNTRRGAVWFIGRANHPTAPTEFVFARFDSNTVRFGCVAPGYSIASPYWFGPAQPSRYGSYMQFVGGVADQTRRFRLVANGTIVGTVDDTSGVSVISPNHVYTGFGLEHDQVDLVNRSPSISHFFINDNVPAATVAGYCKVFRSSTGSVTLSAGKLPNNFMNSVDRAGRLFEPVLGDNSGVRVLETGAYSVELAIKKSNTTTVENAAHYLRLYVGNILSARGGSDHGIEVSNVSGTNPADLNPRMNGVALRATVYCQANDIIYPGYDGSAFAGVGAADGVTTHMTIVKAA